LVQIILTPLLFHSHKITNTSKHYTQS